jgi:hypothetical protein
MKSIRLGDRGPAVEDIQRRLLQLGYDLGPTGVDGVFLGRTAEAVAAFQTVTGLAEDSVVGPLTWAALVDATFTLGDRVLYLRLPHFHGHDVEVLQEALNSLGFACGQGDGIFGAFTERAVSEFQRNAGLEPDGIVGHDTVRAVLALRHVWTGKGARSHSEAHIGLARAADVLSRVPIALQGLDDVGDAVAGRAANLAFATTTDARVTVVARDGAVPEGMTVAFLLCGSGMVDAPSGVPVVKLEETESMGARLKTAVESAVRSSNRVVVELDVCAAGDEHAEQRAAVRLLDTVCSVFD